MRNQQGISLIELTMFIVLMALVGIALFTPMRMKGMDNYDFVFIAQAQQLDQSRLEVIIGQAKKQPFSSLSDICNQKRAVCPASEGLRVSSNISNEQSTRGVTYKTVTATTSGGKTSSLTRMLGDVQ